MEFSRTFHTTCVTIVLWNQRKKSVAVTVRLLSCQEHYNRESHHPRFEYPIVRHNPLFAKQKSAGDRSNLSSLLLGQNVRIIRRSVGGIGIGTACGGSAEITQPHAEVAQSSTSRMKSFEIFNPETDDLDSDDEASDVDDDEESIKTRDNESEEESDSNDDSVESVVSVVSLATEKMELPQQKQGRCCSLTTY